MQKPKINIYTDGACSGNPGPGGYGAILEYNGKIKELCGGEKMTTNNKMEITAVIKALEALKKPCDVMLFTDSKYVVDSIQKGWVYKWRDNGWMRTKKDKALNSELWQRLLELLEVHNVEFNWVKGHAGHPQNERCDYLAVNSYKKYL